MENNKAPMSWLDLTDEEIMTLSDVSVCMYSKQDKHKN